VKLLVEALQKKGKDVVQTREMGGTPAAEMLRPIVQSGESDRWDALSETLLYYAARRDHVRKLIYPSIQAGKWVVSDRFYDSTTVYQSVAQGLDKRILDEVRRVAIGDFKPDLTIILDFDPAAGLQRAFVDAKARAEDNTRFERKGLDFPIRIRGGYLDVAKVEPERCKLVDARGSIDEVAARVWTVVAEATKL
jgi:dTMP kinase